MLYNDAQVDLIVCHLRRFSVKSQPLPLWLLLFSLGIYVGNCEGCCENLIMRAHPAAVSSVLLYSELESVLSEWSTPNTDVCLAAKVLEMTQSCGLLWCIFHLSAKQRIWLRSTNIWQVLSSGNAAVWCLSCDNVKPLMQRK